MDEITLVIKDMGHVPAFKNKKRIMRGRLITDPRAQKWMSLCVSSFKSQLRRLFQTSDGATSTGQWQLSAMSSLPYDDNWKAIPQICVSVRQVEKGEQGAIIRLKKISQETGQ